VVEACPLNPGLPIGWRCPSKIKWDSWIPYGTWF